MSLESPLARVRGLGSAKEGAGHWWWQRLTAVALVPLTIWFVFTAISMTGASYAEAVAFFQSPWRAALMVIFLGALFYHGQLGLQVVIEDYVSDGGLRLVFLLFVKFAAVLLAVAAIISVLRLAVSG